MPDRFTARLYEPTQAHGAMRQAWEQAERIGAEPLLLYRRNREPWQALIHTVDGQYREDTLIDAAGAVREKWLRWPPGCDPAQRREESHRPARV